MITRSMTDIGQVFFISYLFTSAFSACISLTWRNNHPSYFSTWNSLCLFLLTLKTFSSEYLACWVPWISIRSPNHHCTPFWMDRLGVPCFTDGFKLVKTNNSSCLVVYSSIFPKRYKQLTKQMVGWFQGNMLRPAMKYPGSWILRRCYFFVYGLFWASLGGGSWPHSNSTAAASITRWANQVMTCRDKKRTILNIPHAMALLHTGPPASSLRWLWRKRLQHSAHYKSQCCWLLHWQSFSSWVWT